MFAIKDTLKRKNTLWEITFERGIGRSWRILKTDGLMQSGFAQARPGMHLMKFLGADQGAHFFAFEGADQGLRIPQVQHQDGKIILHAQGNRRAVHHLETAI